MSDHKKLSPSKFVRARLCPASPREEAKYPEKPGGPAALEGSKDHLLLEVCVDNGVISATEMIGQTISNEWIEPFVVDKDRAERVQVAIEYIRTRIMDMGFAPVHSEMTLDSTLMFGRDDMGGTCDIHIVNDSILEVADYKGGMAPVDLPCDQLDLYSIMLLGIYQDKDIKTVRQTIIQPKLAYRGESGIVSIDVPVDELLAKRQMYIDAAVATEAPDAPFNPGDVQCKYCAHKGACSALANQTMTSSGITFENLSQQAADKEPTSLTDVQIREILEAAPLIRQMIEGVEAEALRRFEAGQPIEGLKAVRGRGSRAWMYDEEATAKSLIKFGIPKSAIYQTKLVSPAQVEKLTWEKRDGTKKQLTDKQLKVLQSEYIKKSDGKLCVVPETDDRPAVTISAAGMFAPVVADLPSFLLPL